LNSVEAAAADQGARAPQSLGCLAAPVVESGVSGEWRNPEPEAAPAAAAPSPGTDPDPTPPPARLVPPGERRAYGVTADDGTVINATAEWFGNFTLNNGAQARGRLPASTRGRQAPGSSRQA